MGSDPVLVYCHIPRALPLKGFPTVGAAGALERDMRPPRPSALRASRSPKA